MNPAPIAFASPEVERVLSGKLTFFRRLASGALGKSVPGRKLWLREPFHLDPKHDDHKPTVARDLGATPIFRFEPRPKPGTPLGILRAGRFLCRDWHRFHLVITGIEQQRLREITAEEIERMGIGSRFEFAEVWNEGVSLNPRGNRWSDDPTVLRFDFELVKSALPPPPKPTPKRQAKPVKEKPPAIAATVPPAVVPSRPDPRSLKFTPPPAPPPPPPDAYVDHCRGLASPGRISQGGKVRLSAPAHLVGACERCGVRFAHGCEHYPKEEMA